MGQVEIDLMMGHGDRPSAQTQLEPKDSLGTNA